MELRPRSRSKTPFPPPQTVVESIEGSNHVTIRSTRSTTTVKSSSSSSSGFGGVSSEQYYSSSDDKPAINTRLRSGGKSEAISGRHVTGSSSAYKTSDYSSEEGEVETRHISQNQKNQIVEDAKRAANGSTEISALDLYRRAGRYWDKYPKTDWTYSPHSRDRVELAPGVVQMPNMSRRTIHSYDSSTNTDAYLYENALKSRSIKQRLFTSSINNNTEDDSFKIYRKSSSKRTIVSTITTTIVSIFVSIYSAVFWCFYYAHDRHNSSFIWLGKKLHHLTSRLMLFDTWLLRKQRKTGKIHAVVVLCLLPLLLFAGWWLLSSLGTSIYSFYLTPSTEEIALLPIVDISKSDLADENQIEPPQQNLYPPLPPASEEHLAPTPSVHYQQEINTDEIVQKILESPNIQNIINNYNTNILKVDQKSSEQDEKLLVIINDLKQEINKVKEELSKAEQDRTEDIDKLRWQFRSENARTVTRLTHELKRCCQKSVINLEPYVTKILGDLLNNPEFLSKQDGLSKWLHALFVAKQDLESRLSNVTQHLSKDYDVHIQETARTVMDDVVVKIAPQVDSSTITDQRIKEIVQSALMVYDADKTGLVDYAMEPMGGQVVTTRCTETYHSGTAVVSVMGIPLWYPTNSPRIVITPGVNPGECWAFQNFPGFLVIKLSTRVKVEAFSLEHISKLLVPGGKVDSAPKEFEVYGLADENDKDPVLLGQYVYDAESEPIQYFAAHQHGHVVDLVEVRVKSNHGNPNYTCLYRFRVHGSVVDEST